MGFAEKFLQTAYDDAVMSIGEKKKHGNKEQKQAGAGVLRARYLQKQASMAADDADDDDGGDAKMKGAKTLRARYLEKEAQAAVEKALGN